MIAFNMKRNIIRNHPYTAATALVALIVIGFFTTHKKSATPTDTSAAFTPRTVELLSLSSLGGGAINNYTATPDALIIHSEGAGRVTRTAKVGDKVNAGDVIASLENSAQLASLTSAEGALKAAQAGKDIASLGEAPSAAGLSSAQSSARSAIGAAYNFIDDAVRTKTDPGFLNSTNDDSRRFLVDTPDIEYNQFVNINNDRHAFIAILNPANTPIDRMQNDAQLETLTREELSNLSILSHYLSDLSFAWNKASQHPNLTPDLIASQRATVAALRATLPQIQGQLTQAQSALAQAKLGKATNASQLSTSGTAAAQIEIAQGSVEAARSAYEKTIVRAPASGTITGVNIHVGDFITPGANVVLIAPTGPIASGTYSLPLKSVKYDATETYVLAVVDGKTVAYQVKTGLLTADTITVTIISSTTPTSIISDVRGLKTGELVTVK